MIPKLIFEEGLNDSQEAFFFQFYSYFIKLKMKQANPNALLEINVRKPNDM